jgi:hypothetical protein
MRNAISPRTAFTRRPSAGVGLSIAMTSDTSATPPVKRKRVRRMAESGRYS